MSPIWKRGGVFDQAFVDRRNRLPDRVFLDIEDHLRRGQASGASAVTLLKSRHKPIPDPKPGSQPSQISSQAERCSRNSAYGLIRKSEFHTQYGHGIAQTEVPRLAEVTIQYTHFW
jgi:hypothetical protein